MEYRVVKKCNVGSAVLPVNAAIAEGDLPPNILTALLNDGSIAPISAPAVEHHGLTPEEMKIHGLN